MWGHFNVLSSLLFCQTPSHSLELSSYPFTPFPFLLHPSLSLCACYVYSNSYVLRTAMVFKITVAVLHVLNSDNLNAPLAPFQLSSFVTSPKTPQHYQLWSLSGWKRVIVDHTAMLRGLWCTRAQNVYMLNTSHEVHLGRIVKPMS